MTDRLEVWRCPECGGASYYWHFDAPDGTALMAEVGSMPDFSGLDAAKERALAERAKEMLEEFS